MSEDTRKASYRYVAELLGRAAHPPELQLEVERIRRAMQLAGDVPPATSTPVNHASSPEASAAK